MFLTQTKKTIFIFNYLHKNTKQISTYFFCNSKYILCVKVKSSDPLFFSFDLVFYLFYLIFVKFSQCSGRLYILRPLSKKQHGSENLPIAERKKNERCNKKATTKINKRKTT